MCFDSSHDGRGSEHFASHIPHDSVLTPVLLSGVVLWFEERKAPELVGAQIPFGGEAVGCRLRHETQVVIGSGLGSDLEVHGGWKEAARMVQLEKEKNPA